MATYSLEEVTSGKKTYSLEEVMGTQKEIGFFDESPLAKLTKPQNIKDAIGGAVRGAGSIGATALLPADMINQKLRGEDFFSLKDNRERRAGIDAGLETLGADPTSGLYQTVKLSTEVAGTAGLPIGVGKVVEKVAPKLGNAITSGGFNLGTSAPKALSVEGVKNGATRVVGGAISGGLQAGVVDPEAAKFGAAVGGGLPVATKAAAMVGSGTKTVVGSLASNLLGLTTGTGANSVKEAYKAGTKGSTSFLDNMRGNVSMDDVIAEAKTGLSNMRAERAAEYKNGMAAISNDKTVLDYAPILDSVKKIQSLGSYKGQVINQNSSKTVDEIAGKIDEWAKLDPAEFHTPEGLDALKQSIGDIRDTTQFGTQARKAADSAYNAVKDQIVKQAPTYSKTMKGYSEASQTLNEIEKALSLGNKASADTSIRKLQSLMRNNVQTNYGNRLNLANTLSEKGGKDILPSVAGQAMNSWTPRGLIGAGESGAGIMAAVLNPATIPHLLAAAPLASPRLVGESAYKLGSAVSGVNYLPKLLNSNPGLLNAEKLLGTNPNLYRGLLQMSQPAMTSQ
jgi:hypothetical protein